MHVTNALLSHRISRRGGPPKKRFGLSTPKTVFSLIAVDVAPSKFAEHLSGSAFSLGTFFARLCLYLGK